MTFTFASCVRVPHFIVGGSTMLLLALICFVLPVDGFDQRRCILHRGECVLQCPRLMHPYHTRCDRDTLSQRTCDDPEVFSLGYTCGWSRCDCNGDNVLDETTGHCMESLECPETRHVHKRRQGRRRNSGPRRKKIRYNEPELPELE